MPTKFHTLLTLLVLILAGGGSSAEAKDFVTMPEAKGAEKNLEIRFVKYDGSTNGEMVVQVKNTGKTIANFKAEGLFFVPEGSPEKAPQRLGASGPFTEMVKGKPQIHNEKLALRPGESKTLRLEVFCIDSHRSSPKSSTQFSLAKNKMPKKMQRSMKTGNAEIYRKNKGNLRQSKSAVQSHMWKTRDANWVPLEGERAVEKVQAVPQRNNAPSKRPLRHRRHRQNATP